MGALHERPEFVFEQRDARGGLSRKVSPHLIQANQVYEAQDCYLHRGGFRKTSGHSAALTTAVTATPRGLSARRVYDKVSGALTVAHYADGKAYRLSGARMGVIGSGFSQNVRLSMAEANRLLYATDGVVYRRWSGTRANPMGTATAPAEMPRFVYFHPYANRMFAGRGTTTVHRVWWSDINANETWQTNSYVDVPQTRLGEKVMGFAPLGKELVVFTERTVSVLTGAVPSDFRLRTMEWTHGCHYPFTIVSFGSYILYLSIDGIYKFDGSGEAKKISEAIDDIIADIVTTSENGPVAEMNREGHYVLSYSSSSSGAAALANNRELTVLKPVPEAPYWHFQGPNTRGFGMYARYVGGTDVNETYAVSSAADGQFFKLDSGVDYAGSGATPTIITGQSDMGDPWTRKVFQGVEIHAEAHGDFALEIDYKIDNEANWNRGGTVSLAARGPEYGSKTLNMVNRKRAIHPLTFPDGRPLVGNYIQLRITQRGRGGVYQPVNILMFRVYGKTWSKA